MTEGFKGSELTPSPLGFKGKQRARKRSQFETSCSSKSSTSQGHRKLDNWEGALIHIIMFCTINFF